MMAHVRHTSRSRRWLRAGRRGLRRGLTLVEVVISVSVLLIIATIGWSSVQSAVEIGEILAQGDATTRTARVVLGRLRRELQLAYLTPNIMAVNSYRTVFVGFDDNPDKVFFATLAHQRIYRDSRESDQAEVTIWAETAPREISEGYVLYHRESERIDMEPDEGGRIWPLAYNVRSFDLRYLDNRVNEWRDVWDTRTGDTPYILPRAVQVGLVLIAPDPEDDRRRVDRPYFTTIQVEYADPIIPLLGGMPGGVPPGAQQPGGPGGMPPAMQPGAGGQGTFAPGGAGGTRGGR